MPPKKKAQKMALADFFADTTTGSWADDDMPQLPTGPAARDPSLPRRGEPGYLDSMPDRSARSSFPSAPPREELPLPTVPPFTAYIGNLTFETEESELLQFFSDLGPSSVRLVKDPTGKSKGFGYVEFPTVDKLKDALARSMTPLEGRAIRVSVAEAPASSRREGFGPSAADDAGQWRRTTPLPARADAPVPRQRPSFSAEPGPDRDWSAARGSKFTPSATPPTPSGLRRDSSGPGREREYVPSAADEVNQWRSARPLVEPIRGGGRDLPPHQRSEVGSAMSSPSLAEAESTWSRGTKLRTPVLETPADSTLNTPTDDREWRSSRATSAIPSAGSGQGSADGNSPLQAPAPLERRKINLAPRSVPPTPALNDSSSEPTSNTKGIFGSAKPIDSASREREAAEKLAQRDDDRRKAREVEVAKAKEEDDKARQFSEERAKAIRDAQEKARAELAGAPNGGAEAGRGERSRNTNVRPTRKVSNDVKSPKSPVSPSTEDGFEGTVSRGPKAAPRETNGQAEKKDNPARKGFSFAAAAAAAGGLVDEDEDEGKTNGDVNGINRVTEKLGEVEV